MIQTDTPPEKQPFLQSLASTAIRFGGGYLALSMGLLFVTLLIDLSYLMAFDLLAANALMAYGVIGTLALLVSTPLVIAWVLRQTWQAVQALNDPDSLRERRKSKANGVQPQWLGVIQGMVLPLVLVSSIALGTRGLMWLTGSANPPMYYAFWQFALAGLYLTMAYTQIVRPARWQHTRRIATASEHARIGRLIQSDETASELPAAAEEQDATTAEMPMQMNVRL